jgi:hypothetical protein
MRYALFASSLLLATSGGQAQHAAPAPSVLSGPPAVEAKRSGPISILFIGNSFTQGAHSAVRNWRADSVTDLNGDGYGGVPALFKAFTEQAGLDYRVSLETQGGKSLGFHYDERRGKFDRPWDVVVLQEFSTLNREHPGDSTDYVRDVGRIGRLLRARNSKVRIELMATWSRADATYRGKGPWSDTPIATMANDLQKAAHTAKTANPFVRGIIPVGTAWNLAFERGVADPDPYDGTSFGQLDLWTYDQYHASVAGYYLEALVVFGAITGVDPSTLGRDERAADALGLSPADAVRLQQIASQQLRQRD